ncbi:hypothetical protein [Bacillus luti]|uniref:hypothetical protein n=1 Tax=Bacillus luti TaxID=2026191 RepID=UPI0028A185D4|nr:hypothetical protein [Bacillus luti]
MSVTFKKAKKKTRNELQLPILHFVCMDDWIEKLGDKAFTAWLKFYTWCNREEDENGNRPNDDVIPSSLTKVQKRLGVGKDTFYNKILKPLWNHGLIDVFEYKSEGWKGQGNVNIIVYEYPQNEYALSTKPLEKIRDYDTDYTSQAKIFAKLGGRPKKTGEVPGSEIEQGDGSEIEQGVFSNGTGPRSEIEPNNVSNNLSNVSKLTHVSKLSSNDSNNLSNDKNLQDTKNNWIESQTELSVGFSYQLNKYRQKFSLVELGDIAFLYQKYHSDLLTDEVFQNFLVDIAFRERGKGKNKVGNVKMYFEKCLVNKQKELMQLVSENKNEIVNKPTDKEITSKQEEELDQQNTAAEEANRQATEEEQKRLEEVLKKYKR